MPLLVSTLACGTAGSVPEVSGVSNCSCGAVWTKRPVPDLSSTTAVDKYKTVPCARCSSSDIPECSGTAWHALDDPRRTLQRYSSEKIGGFVETAIAKSEPELSDPPWESRCKVIPFERMG